MVQAEHKSVQFSSVQFSSVRAEAPPTARGCLIGRILGPPNKRRATKAANKVCKLQFLPNSLGPKGSTLSVVVGKSALEANWGSQFGAFRLSSGRQTRARVARPAQWAGELAS